MFIEDVLGDWVHGLDWCDVPGRIKAISRHCVLDGISVALAGSQTPVYGLGANAVRELAGARSGPCTVLGVEGRAEPATAAWLNGMAMHALDFDDTSYAGILHATAVVLPAALAVVQQRGGTLQDLLEAYLAGVEVELALGTALTESLYDRGHWTTSSLGVVGAAAAASKALGLSSAQISQAIRIALNTSIGMRCVHGSSAKPYLCGQAARLGLDAAWAARAGICAGPDTLAGRFGYAAVANREVLLPEAFDRLGQSYYIEDPGMALKMYPVCSAAQAAIQAVLELKSKHGFTVADVAHVQVHGTALVVSCLTHTRPTTVSQAQFSMQFSIATALLQDSVGIEHLDTDWIGSEQVRSVMCRITLDEDSSLVPDYDLLRHPEAGRVTVTLRDSTKLTRTVLAAQGMPEFPLTLQQLKRKFMMCATQVYSREQAEALYSDLHAAAETAELLSLFSVDRRSKEVEA